MQINKITDANADSSTNRTAQDNVKIINNKICNFKGSSLINNYVYP